MAAVPVPKLACNHKEHLGGQQTSSTPTAHRDKCLGTEPVTSNLCRRSTIDAAASAATVCMVPRYLNNKRFSGPTCSLGTIRSVPQAGRPHHTESTTKQPICNTTQDRQHSLHDGTEQPSQNGRNHKARILSIQVRLFSHCT
jgi:hypothetical protein